MSHRKYRNENGETVTVLIVCLCVVLGVFEPDVYLGDGCPSQPAQGQGRCGQRRRPIPQPYPGTECLQAAVGTSCIYNQGSHCTGKTGKMAKRSPCQGKHREFGNLVKTQGKQVIWFAQLGNSLILKVKQNSPI